MDQTGYRLPELITGRLIRRYKRFLADVRLDTGEEVTAHCPNSGSMKGCAIEGARVWLSLSDNPKRKYRHTWELIQAPDTLIGINTIVPNRLVKLAAVHGAINEFNGYANVSSEVKTSAHTRLDLLLENAHNDKHYVEIKNCTLVEDGVAMFPDAVTTRGQKHLEELEMLAAKGHQASVFFLIQRMDAKVFRPADHIDRAYGEMLRKAVQNGVKIIVRDTCIDTREIRINRRIPVDLGM